MITTNSMPMADKETECGKLKTLSIAGLLADAIRSIHMEESVSRLFDIVPTPSPGNNVV